MASRQTYNFTNISSATTVVQKGPGTLHTLVVNTTAAGAITLYDGLDTTGTKIATIDVSPVIGSTFRYDVEFAKGLTIVTAGASDITVSVAAGAVAMAAFSPLDIPSLKLWLDGTRGTYVDAGTTLATDGQTIQQWNDQSGQGNHATQAGAGARPTYRLTGGSNSKPALEFITANSNSLVLPDFMTGFTNGEMHIVIKLRTDPPASTATAGIWTLGGDAASADFFPWTDGVIYDGFMTDTRKTTVDPTPALTSWHLYNNISAGAVPGPAEWTSNLDGTQIFTTATNVVATTASPRLGGTFVSGFYLDGYISEVFIFNAKLSAGQRTSLKAYIATKYALTIA